MCIEYLSSASATVTLIYTGTFVSVENLCLAGQNGTCARVVRANVNIKRY
jgi:hypothetical protein